MSLNPRDVIAPQGDEMRNEGEPCYWSDINPQDVGLDFNADEELSSEASVEKIFDKMEFLNKHQEAVNNVITHMIMKVAEESQSSKCSQQLCEKNVMPPPPKIHDTNSFARQNSINSHQTWETDNFICQFVKSDSGGTECVQQKIGMTADHWAAVEKDVTQWKCQAIQLEKTVAEAEVKKLYLQKQLDDIIQAAVQRARTAHHELDKI